MSISSLIFCFLSGFSIAGRLPYFVSNDPTDPWPEPDPKPYPLQRFSRVLIPKFFGGLGGVAGGAYTQTFLLDATSSELGILITLIGALVVAIFLSDLVSLLLQISPFDIRKPMLKE